MGEVKYDYESNQYCMGVKEWPKKTEVNNQVIKDTEPYTLKTVVSRSMTLNDRLFIMHNLCPKDESQSQLAMKTPVRVMDFNS